MNNRPLTKSDIQPFNGSVTSIVWHEFKGEFQIGQATSLYIEGEEVVINLSKLMRVEQTTPSQDGRKVWTIINGTLKNEYSLVITKPEVTDDQDSLVFVGDDGSKVTITHKGVDLLLYGALIRQYIKQN